jgi:hypothetical protein
MRKALNGTSILSVTVFAIAMAFLEGAVVVYLRRIAGITDPIQGAPLDATIGPIEVGREAATLVMLAAVGWIAGKKFQARLGYAVIAFGVWDIFYYVWLRVLTGWPHSLLDPDILFLIPLPWWGPVIAPVLISLLMIAAGAVLVVREEQGMRVRLDAPAASALGLGVAAMLYAFMADALSILPASAVELSLLGPGEFRWIIFLIGLGMAGAAIGRLARSRDAAMQIPMPAGELDQ